MSRILLIKLSCLLLAVLLLVAVHPGGLSATNSAAAADNPIVVENRQPGSDKWKLGRPGFATADDKGKQIKGYASATSINKGQPISFFISVSPIQSYAIDVYRLGWYQGKGGRLLQHIGPLEGVEQPACPIDATTGLIACAWSPSYTLNVPDTWTSGVYVALLTNAQNYQNYIVFVVRDDQRIADLLYQQPVTTYQAYNNYPDDGITGKSLYDSSSYGANTISGSRRAVQISFDRPYKNNGAGDLLKVEQYFIRWLERSAFDVAYSTNIDTHANGDRLQNYKGFLSVGHDEYWSKEMYDAAWIARDRGTNLGFFGANDIYWQIRFAPASDGTANRIMVCYKDAVRDPVRESSLKTVRWRDKLVNRPEQSLVGIQYTANLLAGTAYTYTAINTTHWVYAGTDMNNGDGVAGVISDETDRYMAEYPLPANKHYTLLSQSSVVNTSNNPDYANSSIYQALSGAWVFAAGAITWSWGLDKTGVADPRIQQMATNILNAFVSSSGPDTTAPAVTAASPADGATDVSLSTSVTVTFNEAVTGVSTSSFTLSGPSGPLTAKVSYDSGTNTATLIPNTDLLAGTRYTAELTSEIKDAVGNALAPVAWSFTTASTPTPTVVTVFLPYVANLGTPSTSN